MKIHHTTDITIGIFPASINIFRKDKNTGFDILTCVNTNGINLLDIQDKELTGLANEVKSAIEVAENQSGILIRKAEVELHELVDIYVETGQIHLMNDDELSQKHIDMNCNNIKGKYFNLKVTE